MLGLQEDGKRLMLVTLKFLSRTGYVIFYADCPVVYISKLQTEIALSTAESEYIALSQAMRDVIPLIQLLTEINCLWPVMNPEPKIRCTIFEDNESCIAIAKSQKFTPRTRHITIKYHHFRHYVDKCIVQILPINAKDQTADIFTKPLPEDVSTRLSMKLCGW